MANQLAFECNLSELPYLAPVLQGISHVVRSKNVRLVVANAHNAGSIKVDVLYLL